MTIIWRLYFAIKLANGDEYSAITNEAGAVDCSLRAMCERWQVERTSHNTQFINADPILLIGDNQTPPESPAAMLLVFNENSEVIGEYPIDPPKQLRGDAVLLNRSDVRLWFENSEVFADRGIKHVDVETVAPAPQLFAAPAESSIPREAFPKRKTRKR